MANVTTAFVKQFAANIMHLVQQKGSRLRPTIMIEPGVVGEEASFDQLGTTKAQKKTTRNADTPLSQPDHARRWVTLFDYEVAKLHDKQDQLKMLSDPTSRYVQSGAWALGRAMDDEIIAAATGTARTGKTGSDNITLPSAQKVAHSSTGMTIAKILAAKEILDTNEADEDEPRFMIVTAGQVTDLLNTTEVKSADYNTVKALAAGQIDTFCGFKFVRTQRLGTDSDSNRQVLAYNKSGILLAIAQDIVSDIGPRRDKSMATQVYLSLGVGSVRMEEERVVEIACTE
jgi:hypothetical protein